MPHDRDLSPKPTASEPSSAAVVSESPAASESTTFTSSGPVPPVASSAGSSAPAPPSASERAYGAASGPVVAAGPVVAPADAMVTRLNSGDLDEHQLNQLTPDQVAQVDSAGAAPRNILQRAMHESWHHAKEVLLAPGGNAPARQALMRKLWEFRQWHHELILQRTKDDPSLGKDGLKEWKSAGSKTLTSDIDVNLKGTKTEQAVAVFNRKFKADGGGWAHEAGVVYDVNVYALDFMHKDTFSGLAEEGGEISPHKFGQTDAASGAPLPDPATRVAAKEGAREGSAGGGVGAHSDILGPRMVQADAGLQRVWSLVKMRLYMTGAEWAEYVRDAQVPDGTQQEVELRYASYNTQLNQRMGAVAAADADAQRVTGFALLEKRAHANAGGRDAENVKMEASNRIYEEKLVEMGTLRTQLKAQIEQRKVWLAAGRADDAEALDAAIDGNLAILRDLISECAMFSNEAYVTDGAVNHTVVGLQSKVAIRQTKAESMDAFNENVGDSLKEITRHSATLGEAAYKAGKYLWRMADAAKNLGVASSEADAELGADIDALYQAGNTVANKIKGGDETQAELDAKAATAIGEHLGDRASDPIALKAFVRGLASRVATAASEAVTAHGQDRAATIRPAS